MSGAHKWTRPSDGWIVGRLRGHAGFSDGHAMFIGRPPHKGKTRKLSPGSFDKALKEPLSEKLRPTELVKRALNGDLPCVVLRGDTWIQEKFYNYAMSFKGVQLFLGKNYYGNRAVICKVGRKIVGCILPIRKP